MKLSADAAIPRVILIVEDADEDFDTACEALLKIGVAHEVHRAMTGDECRALLRGDGTERPLRPALVIMDLKTPGTDGRDALAELKADPTLEAIPVVVFSTSGSAKDIAFCYASGANAYHVKPVRYPDHVNLLVDVMTYWLRHVALPVVDVPRAAHS